MGVEKVSVSENMMTSVVQGREFDEYTFDCDEGDEFIVHVRICMRTAPAQQGKSWSEEQEQCLNQISQNAVCDAALSRDANCGVSTVMNYQDNGFSTRSHALSEITDILEQPTDIKGWQTLFQSVSDDPERKIQILGAAPNLFEEFAK